MIRLYLVRHAAQKKVGDTCGLTARGKRRFRRIARAFARLREPIDVVCTSPRPQARETAAILARSLGRPSKVLEALAPGTPVELLLHELAVLTSGDGGGVALIGHKSQFKRLLARLGVGKGKLRLRKGSIVRVDIDAAAAPRACIPRFRLRPSTGELEDAFVGLRRAS